MTYIISSLTRAAMGVVFLLGAGAALAIIPALAAIIAVVGCFQGFRTKGGADSVGRQTTRAVVQSTFLVIVADAVGGTSATAHEMALRRIEQAGGRMISVPQLFCELQRDWNRKDTVPAFMSLFIETGGTAGIQFSYDRTE